MSEPTELRFGPYRVWEMDAKNVCVERDTGEQAKDRAGNPKPGETTKAFIGYYDSFAPALRSALRDGLKGKGATDAKKLAEHIDMALAAITAAVRLQAEGGLSL